MSTSNEETDCSGFVKSLNDGIARGIPIESILKSMPQGCINAYLLGQVESLSKQHDELAEQFRTVISAVKVGNKNVTDRIEHILALMTSNMMFVKQMIQFESSSLARLDDQEKTDAKLELQFSTVINRQNQFSQCIENMNKNSKALLEAIEELRANDVNNDKFKTKVTVIASLCAIVIYWIMSGLNLGKIMEFIQSLAPRT
jgi:hypothetical protein